MINVISKPKYPDDWNSFIDDYVDFSSQEHRRNSNFYTRLIYRLDEENAENYPQLWGMWETETIIWDSEYGLEDKPTILYRVNKVKKTVVTEEWIRVKDETVDSQ